MLNIGPQELIIILVIALLVIGPHRLPELARSIGRGLQELRKAQDEVRRTIKVNLDDEPSNGGTRRRSTDRASGDTPVSADRPSAVTPPVAPDATPTASEPLPASEVREISRSLGRSLAELRKAKEEVQRSFRVDPTGPASIARPRGPKPATSRPPAPRAPTPEEAGPATDDPPAP